MGQVITIKRHEEGAVPTAPGDLSFLKSPLTLQAAVTSFDAGGTMLTFSAPVFVITDVDGQAMFIVPNGVTFKAVPEFDLEVME